jgi:AraC-like DNA-binding protein
MCYTHAASAIVAPQEAGRVFYQEYRPSARLAPHVQCYWLLRTSANPFPTAERLIPDGRIELIFTFAGPYRRSAADGAAPGEIIAASHIVGERTRGYLIEQFGAIDHVAVRFKPGGLYPFVALPPAELTDRAVEADQIFGADLRSLEERLFELADDRERVAALEAALLRRLRAADRQVGLAQRAVACIAEARGGAAVEAVADRCGVSRRQLERTFRDVVGVTPKRYSRIVRFLTVLDRLRRAGAADWGDTAYACGYADQAHLIKDFKVFTGLSPTRYVAQSNRIAAMLTEERPLSHSSKTAT